MLEIKVENADGFVEQQDGKDIWATQSQMEPSFLVFDLGQRCKAERRAAGETRELLVKSIYAPSELVKDAECEVSEIEKALKVASKLVERRHQNNVALENKCGMAESDCSQIVELIQDLEAQLATFGDSTAVSMQDCLNRYEQEILQLENELEEGEKEKNRLAEEIDEVISDRNDAVQEVQLLDSKRDQWYELIQLLDKSATEKKVSAYEAPIPQQPVDNLRPPVSQPRAMTASAISQSEDQLSRNASDGILQMKEPSGPLLSAGGLSSAEAAAAQLHHDLDEILLQFAGSTTEWRDHILGAVKRHLVEVDALAAEKTQPVASVYSQNISAAVDSAGRRPKVALSSSEVVGHRSQLPSPPPSWSGPIVRGNNSSASRSPGRVAGLSHAARPVAQTVIARGSPSSHQIIHGSYQQSWPCRPAGSVHHNLGTGTLAHGQSHGHVAVTSPRLQAHYSTHAVHGSH